MLRQRTSERLFQPGRVGRGGNGVCGPRGWTVPPQPNSFYSLIDIKIANFEKEVFLENEQAVSFLENTVREGDVVITHHLPSWKSISPRFQNNDLNQFYVCDMSDLICRAKPAFWFHGHTHTANDYLVGDTRIICNPFGYPWEHISGYSEKKIVVI